MNYLKYTLPEFLILIAAIWAFGFLATALTFLLQK